MWAMSTFAFPYGPQASGLPCCLLQPSLVGSSASHLASLGNLLPLFWVLPLRPGLSGKRGGCPSFQDAAEGTASSLQSPQTGLSSVHTPWRRPHFPRTETYAKHKTKPGDAGCYAQGQSGERVGHRRKDTLLVSSVTHQGGLTFRSWGTPPGKQGFPPGKLCTCRSKIMHLNIYIMYIHAYIYIYCI